jgi:hypothetical protein
MTRAKRTDPHRPGAIIPSEYSFLVSYSLAHTDNGWPVPAVGIEGVLHFQKLYKLFNYGPGSCSICGAAFIHGDLWLHEPTQQLIHVGHICAAKY